MKIKYFDNEELMSEYSAKLIIEEITLKEKLLLCTASGNSPYMTYQILVKEYHRNPQLFNQVTLLKLDEWGGIPKEDPQTCESFLRTNLVEPLQIPASRYISFESNPVDPEKECDRISAELNSRGPIDICLLGLGLNGHIAFNEPDQFLRSHCHVARLSEKSFEHPMAKNMERTPTYGLTIGMKDILQSGKIIILVTGERKKEIITNFLSKRITTLLPASFLWLHSNVECLINKHAIN